MRTIYNFYGDKKKFVYINKKKSGGNNYPTAYKMHLPVLTPRTLKEQNFIVIYPIINTCVLLELHPYSIPSIFIGFMFGQRILIEKSNLSKNWNFYNLELIVWMFFFFEEFKFLKF